MCTDSDLARCITALIAKQPYISTNQLKRLLGRSEFDTASEIVVNETLIALLENNIIKVGKVFGTYAMAEFTERRQRHRLLADVSALSHEAMIGAPVFEYSPP
jgi:hypothetical protein